MTGRHRLLVPLSALVILLAVPLVSCISTKSQAFKMSFLPSTPAHVESSSAASEYSWTRNRLDKHLFQSVGKSTRGASRPTSDAWTAAPTLQAFTLSRSNHGNPKHFGPSGKTWPAACPYTYQTRRAAHKHSG